MSRLMHALRFAALWAALLFALIAAPALASFPVQLDAQKIQVLQTGVFEDGSVASVGTFEGDFVQAGAYADQPSTFLAVVGVDGEVDHVSVVRPGPYGGDLRIKDLEVEDDGLDRYVYVAGEFNGTYTFGTHQLDPFPNWTMLPGCVATTSTGVFIARYHVDEQKWLWARAFASFNYECANPVVAGPGVGERMGGFAVGDDGFVYISTTAAGGLFSGMFLGGDPLYDYGITSHTNALILRTPKLAESDPSYPSEYRSSTWADPRPETALRVIEESWDWDTTDNRSHDIAWDNGAIWHSTAKQVEWVPPAPAPADPGAWYAELHRVNVPPPSSTDRSQRALTKNYKAEGIHHLSQLAVGRTGVLHALATPSCALSGQTFIVDGITLTATTAVSPFTCSAGVDLQYNFPGYTVQGYVLAGRFTGTALQWEWGFEATADRYLKQVGALVPDGNGSVYVGEVERSLSGNVFSPVARKVSRWRRTDATSSTGTRLWSTTPSPANTFVLAENESEFVPIALNGRDRPEGSSQIYTGGSVSAATTFGAAVVTPSSGQRAGYIATLDPVGNWIRYYDVTLGTQVPQPAGTASTQPTIEVGSLPAEEAAKHFFWDATNSRLYAVRPGGATVLWTSSYAGDPPITQGVTATTPAAPQYHAAGAPAYLDSSDSSWAFQEMHYNEGELSAIGGQEFTREELGWSVLRYAKAGQPPSFDVVRTVPPADALLGFAYGTVATVGVPLTETFHADKAGKTGWVMAEQARPFDPTAPYDRSTRDGRIVPVNQGWLDVVWSTRSTSSGVAWPDTARLHLTLFPTTPTPPKILVDNGVGSGPISFKNPRIYWQGDVSLPGFNPNDEHALLAPATPGSNSLAVFALRHEGSSASLPYVVLKHRNTLTDPWSYQVYKVEQSGTAPFSTDVTVGDPLLPPYPLPVVGDCPDTYGEGTGYWEDVRGKPFARSDGPAQVYFHYPLLEGFYWDPNLTGENTGALGDCVPYRRNSTTGDVLAWDYNASWPTVPKVLRIGDRLFNAKDGLPDLRRQAAAEVVFEGGLPGAGTPSTEYPSTKLVRLTDPLSPRSVPVAVGFSMDAFALAPYEIRVRLEHDPIGNTLSFGGYLDESVLGEPILLPNVMLAWERDTLKNLASCTSACDGYVDALYTLSRNPNGVTASNPIAGSTVLAGLEDGTGGTARPAGLVGVEAMLTAGGARDEGWVSVALNNDAALDPQATPTEVVPIRIACTDDATPTGVSYLGTLHQMPTDNIFEQRLVLRHASDFGFEPDLATFTWYLTEASLPAAPRPDSADTPSTDWLRIVDSVAGAHRYSIEGQTKTTIVDNELIAKWTLGGNPACNGEHRWVGDPSSTPASTAPKLAEGWIKRVVRGLNPFKARVTDFHVSPVATYASMIQQAGEPYQGPVTFNGDPDNLNSLGLIEAYETILRSGKQLTIDSSDTESQNSEAGYDALLLASSRIAELYTLLGNEAMADAADPTIGFSTASGEYGTLAPSIFAFQNQVPSLLEEELGLLRGRDGSGAATNLFPVYNRFIWNFTSGEGEVAYHQVYNIDELTDDGLITEADARIAFPQGHGDAWGHFLSAQKRWYDLLRHSEYEWRPRAEKVNVAGTAVTVDYRDERKFAQVAAAKAKAGAEIVDLTYRKEYLEDPAGQFQGYDDPDKQRAWGVDEWARRSGQGAFFDWVMANALLPDAWEQQVRKCALFDATAGGLGPDDQECPEIAVSDTVADVGKIDRTNVPELREIAEQFNDVQRRIDEADSGLNPLGLAKGVVPFDIDPSLLDGGPGFEAQTHFEQVYDRAVSALENAVSVFDHAQSLTRSLRRNQDSLDDFADNLEDMERDYRMRLIEIFGYPYSDDIGPAGTYPPGYDGPDLYHYMYVDQVGITGERPSTRESITAYYAPFEGIDQYFPASNAAAPPSTTELAVLYEYDPGAAALAKPESWTGSRRAPGRVQETLSDLRQAQIQFERGLREYDNLVAEIGALRDDITRQKKFEVDSLEVLDSNLGKQISLNDKIETAQRTVLALRGTAEFVEGIGSAVAEGLPKVIGLSSDATSGPRAIILTAARIAGHSLNVAASAVEGESLGYEADKEVADLTSSRKLEALGLEQELENMKGDLETMLREEPVKRLEVLNQQEVVQQAAGRYAKTVSEGLLLLDELATLRARAAGDVQEYRYQDMTFRIVRNDAIQKYRAQFDLAARYAYLAATAYDYETNLIGSSSNSGESFLTDIVRHRTLGQMTNGEPRAGSRGLADPLARMKLNFDVLKGQMGFNNPQTETNRFSVRRELLRLRDESDAAWEAELRKYWVDDLWQLPEFRRFARPFAPEAAGAQPGLVIGYTGKGGRELSTTVMSGLNFFGQALGGGDSTYDPTNFATKIRSVGAWFTNYNATGLSNTPRIYLLPVGADVLRSPVANNFGTREWRVVDQALPVPFPIGPTSLSDPEYIPSNDALSDTFTSVRRFSRFRAYHDSGGFNPSETTTDSRLIGRSVWNTRWLLIIPGETLLSDPEQGLETFIEQVDDIQLFFQTYAYSGN